jgi:hypothetical protein
LQKIFANVLRESQDLSANVTREELEYTVNLPTVRCNANYITHYVARHRVVFCSMLIVVLWKSASVWLFKRLKGILLLHIADVAAIEHLIER